jgi:hypothetical protein
MCAGTLRRGETAPGVTAVLMVTTPECKDGRMTEATRGPWYWCLTHARVEPAAGCANAERIGPFDTRADAAAALEHARERTEEWDAEDERWSGGS